MECVVLMWRERFETKCSTELTTLCLQAGPDWPRQRWNADPVLKKVNETVSTSSLCRPGGVSSVCLHTQLFTHTYIKSKFSRVRDPEREKRWSWVEHQQQTVPAGKCCKWQMPCAANWLCFLKACWIIRAGLWYVIRCMFMGTTRRIQTCILFT